MASYQIDVGFWNMQPPSHQNKVTPGPPQTRLMCLGCTHMPMGDVLGGSNKG